MKNFSPLRCLLEYIFIIIPATLLVLPSTPVNVGVRLLVEASWSEWSSWTTCSVSCGEGGFQQKTRTCESEDQSSCPGTNFDGRVCSMGPCPVDGVWLEWDSWTNCSLACGSGTRMRSRECEEPLYGGAPCDGPYNETEACNTDPCPVDGIWISWSTWTSCLVSCGGGLQTRNRTCTGPFHGGQDCNGTGYETLNCNTHHCPIDGGWTSWNEWSSCSVSCNEGKQNRQRSCSNPPPRYQGKECSGRKRQFRVCLLKICPINGGWSLWSPWTECSQTCDWGIRERVRICNFPAPQFGGSYCVGTGRAGASCLLQDCPVNAEWGSWLAWGACSHTCGSNGTYSRIRLCNSPPPLYGGLDCDGPNNMTSECYVTRCEGDGGWSDWSQWTACSQSCEGGLEFRNRTCNNPPPTPPYGEDCRGFSNESRLCNTHICPVHGGWTSWTDWSDCPVTCGGDVQTRYRLCTNPPPLFLGDQCEGDMYDERDCAMNGCPVNGAWSTWENWSACSVTCGGGSMTRARSCSNPAPLWGGKDCPQKDENLQTTDCNQFLCPIDGQWSEWSSWDICPVTCGGFDIYRSRVCDNPIPKHDGRECPGSDTELHNCAEDPCPVNGSWSVWGSWSECTNSCALGKQTRTRSCSDPATDHGGFNCLGEQVEEILEEEEEQACNDHPCPIHGGYSQWSAWPSCPVTCGGASIARYRRCDNPEPQYGGDNCTGNAVVTQICSGHIQCPIDGSWGRWLSWAPCSKSCEGGLTTRIRLCNNPSPLYGGHSCEGESEDTVVCNSFSCPIDGGFSEWMDWEPCSKTCGGGQTIRTRTCTAPPPQHGGLPCYGPYTERKLCAAFYCPVHGGWSNWSPWSVCPVTCSGAIVNRTRTCTNPSPKYDGMPCEGAVEDWMICAGDPCPVNGFWSAWSPWSACSVSCEEGVQIARRGCENPPPQHGGYECPGEKIREVYCTLQPTCPEEVPVASNLTASVHLTEDTMTVIVHWDLVPAESRVDFFVFQVKTPTRFGRKTNDSSSDWVSYAYLPQGVSSLPLRDDDDSGLFTTLFGVRVLVKSEFGERVSEEKFFNVAAYIPTESSSLCLIPNKLWIFLSFLLACVKLV